MSDANQLLGLLQIGTSRAGSLRPAALPPELDGLFPSASGEQDEVRLWLSLAAWSLWTRAGLHPAVAVSALPARAPAEQLQACPPSAEAMLARLLQGGHKPALLREWLRALHRHGGRLPARFLPNLLALGTRQAELRADVVQVLGERGQWLSRFEQDWEWATPAVGEEQRLQLWETGGAEQRHAALLQWRAMNPGAARAALAQAWASEAPESRLRLLSCLALGLGPEDEAFLEASLDDRRKEVRLAAQSMLLKLPGSALRRRLQAQAEPLLRLKRPLLGKASIEVSLPESIDKAAVRDGVGAPAHPALGEKAGWLVDLLTAVDPRVWSERLGASPRDLVLMAAHSDFSQALIRGWSSAVVRGGATPEELGEWVGTLLGFWLAAGQPMRQHYPRDFFDLFARIPPPNLHDYLTGLVGTSRSSWGQEERVLVELLVQAAARSSAPWPAALSRDVVDRMLRELPAIPAAEWELRAALDSLAGVVDPQAVGGLEAGWRAGAPDGGIHDHIARFFDTVRLRHEMSLSFQEPA